jgi:hypothetical protein
MCWQQNGGLVQRFFGDGLRVFDRHVPQAALDVLLTLLATCTPVSWVVSEWGHKERCLREGSFGCVERRRLYHDDNLQHLICKRLYCLLQSGPVRSVTLVLL